MMLAEVAGWGGAGVLLLAYLLLTTGRIAAGRAFQAMNLIGSLGLAVNALVHSAWPSATLNAIWLLIALNGVWVGARREPGPVMETRGVRDVRGG